MAPRARCALPVVASAATDIEVKPAKSSLQNTGLRSPSLPRLRANSNSVLGATRSPAFRPRSSRLTWNGQAVRPFPPSFPSALACTVSRLPADDGFSYGQAMPLPRPLLPPLLTLFVFRLWLSLPAACRPVLGRPSLHSGSPPPKRRPQLSRPAGFGPAWHLSRLPRRLWPGP